jgi:valyl-tRNA synthetase
VAQAELEDREREDLYFRIGFPAADGTRVHIETTRPELLAACVALVAHPDDPRYQPLFGTDVVTPLFGVRVPLRAHTLADPEKGTGVAMISRSATSRTSSGGALPAGASVIQAKRHVKPVMGRGGLGDD